MEQGLTKRTQKRHAKGKAGLGLGVTDLVPENTKKVKKGKYKRKRGDIIVYHNQVRLSLLVCQKVDIICH